MSGGVRVVCVSRAQLVAEVIEVAASHRLTFEEFVALGRSDELDDDRLRDLWLMVGSLL